MWNRVNFSVWQAHFQWYLGAVGCHGNRLSGRHFGAKYFSDMTFVPYILNINHICEGQFPTFPKFVWSLERITLNMSCTCTYDCQRRNHITYCTNKRQQHYKHFHHEVIQESHSHKIKMGFLLRYLFTKQHTSSLLVIYISQKQYKWRLAQRFCSNHRKLSHPVMSLIFIQLFCFGVIFACISHFTRSPLVLNYSLDARGKEKVGLEWRTSFTKMMRITALQMSEIIIRWVYNVRYMFVNWNIVTYVIRSFLSLKLTWRKVHF